MSIWLIKEALMIDSSLLKCISPSSPSIITRLSFKNLIPKIISNDKFSKIVNVVLNCFSSIVIAVSRFPMLVTKVWSATWTLCFAGVNIDVVDRSGILLKAAFDK